MERIVPRIVPELLDDSDTPWKVEVVIKEEHKEGESKELSSVNASYNTIWLEEDPHVNMSSSKDDDDDLGSIHENSRQNYSLGELQSSSEFRTGHGGYRSFSWNRESIEALLEAVTFKYKELKDKMLRKRPIWEAISKLVHEKTGESISGSRCEVKWKNLKRNYRLFNHKWRELGRKPSSSFPPFYEELHFLLVESHEINLNHLHETGGQGQSNETNSRSSGTESQEETSGVFTKDLNDHVPITSAVMGFLSALPGPAQKSDAHPAINPPAVPNPSRTDPATVPPGVSSPTHDLSDSSTRRKRRLTPKRDQGQIEKLLEENNKLMKESFDFMKSYLERKEETRNKFLGELLKINRSREENERRDKRARRESWS